MACQPLTKASVPPTTNISVSAAMARIVLRSGCDYSMGKPYYMFHILITVSYPFLIISYFYGAESAVQICSTAALECVPSCCLLLLLAQKSLLLSFFQSAHERIESNVIFSSFSSLNITSSDFWVIQVTFE